MFVPCLPPQTFSLPDIGGRAASHRGPMEDAPSVCRPTCSCEGSSIVLGASQLAAGYADRLAVLQALGSVAIALCARLEAPLPCKMLDRKHNGGDRLSCSHGWRYYTNLTVAGTRTPLIGGNGSTRAPVYPCDRILAPTVSSGLRLAAEALAAGRCFRWELLPRASGRNGGASGDGQLALPAEIEAEAAKTFEFHWFRGQHVWQQDALVKALNLPSGDKYAQQGRAYTAGCVHAEPSPAVLELVRSTNALLGPRYATVHVRRGDTLAKPGSSEFADFKSRTGGLERVLGELARCDTSAAAIRHQAALARRRWTPRLVFFTDETDDQYLTELRTALEAANASERVLHGDAILRAQAGSQGGDNFLIYAASLVIRERAEWEWRWDRQDCHGSRSAEKASTSTTATLQSHQRRNQRAMRGGALLSNTGVGLGGGAAGAGAGGGIT